MVMSHKSRMDTTIRVQGFSRYKTGIRSIRVESTDIDLAQILIEDGLLSHHELKREGDTLVLESGEEPISNKLGCDIYRGLSQEFGDIHFSPKSDLFAIIPLIGYMFSEVFDISTGEAIMYWLQDKGSKAASKSLHLLGAKSKNAVLAYLGGSTGGTKEKVVDIEVK